MTAKNIGELARIPDELYMTACADAQAWFTQSPTDAVDFPSELLPTTGTPPPPMSPSPKAPGARELPMAEERRRSASTPADHSYSDSAPDAACEQVLACSTRAMETLAPILYQKQRPIAELVKAARTHTAKPQHGDERFVAYLISNEITTSSDYVKLSEVSIAKIESESGASLVLLDAMRNLRRICRDANSSSHPDLPQGHRAFRHHSKFEARELCLTLAKVLHVSAIDCMKRMFAAQIFLQFKCE